MILNRRVAQLARRAIFLDGSGRSSREEAKNVRATRGASPGPLPKPPSGWVRGGVCFECVPRVIGGHSYAEVTVWRGEVVEPSFGRVLRSLSRVQKQGKGHSWLLRSAHPTRMLQNGSAAHFRVARLNVPIDERSEMSGGCRQCTQFPVTEVSQLRTLK